MRVLEAEWLDALPAADARAQQSRRDLRKLNWIMGHARHMARMMTGAKFGTLIDIGSGDGQFALKVARRLARPCRVVCVDRQRVPGAPDDLIVSDVMTFLRGLDRKPGTAIMANLFLHHFNDEALGSLFLEVSRAADCIFACEPRRSSGSLMAIKLLPLIGCNSLTRHDAAASIRAGFVGKELTSFWPDRDGWKVTEGQCGFASHCFMASR